MSKQQLGKGRKGICKLMAANSLFPAKAVVLPLTTPAGCSCSPSAPPSPQLASSADLPAVSILTPCLHSFAGALLMGQSISPHTLWQKSLSSS